MEYLITVVTLTYKKFDKLYNAIDSVLAQDYPKIEYIISDDGSPDFPKEKILDYIQGHRHDNIVNLNIINHKNNMGTVKNLNDALKNATGDIIIPVSADDALMDKNVISKIVGIYKDRNCNVLMVGRALYDGNGRFVRNIPTKKEAKILSKYKSKKYQYQRFITGRFFEAYSGCTLSVKREFINSWGLFDDKYVLWEDGPFFAQYLWKNYMECAFDIIGIRYNDGGVSSGSKHPLLLKDDELYRRTDLIEHLNDLTWGQREIVRYSVMRAGNLSKKNRFLSAIKHPIGFAGKKIYMLGLRLLRD